MTRCDETGHYVIGYGWGTGQDETVYSVVCQRCGQSVGRVGAAARENRELRLSCNTARRWLSMRVKHAGDRLSWWIWP